MRNRHRTVPIGTLLVAAAALALAGARAGTSHFDSVVVSNNFTQVQSGGQSTFGGSVTVSNGLTVAGAMTVPPQGDVEMGPYTNGVSQAGVQGALPLGAAGNLLFHTGSAWSALTNVHYDAASGRLYLNSATNSGTYVETGTGRLVMDDNIVLGANHISRAGGDTGISIESDGDIALGGGDVSLAGGEFTVSSSTGDMSAHDNRITDLAAPTADDDAATKLYVDEAVPPLGCAFRAYQTTQQSVGAGSGATVRMHAEEFDIGGDHTTWTGSDCYFTAPASGYYLLGGGACLLNVANAKNFNVIVKKNGSNLAYMGQMVTGGAGTPAQDGSVLTYLTSGDNVRLYVKNGDSVSRSTLNWSSTCYFWGLRVK